MEDQIFTQKEAAHCGQARFDLYGFWATIKHSSYFCCLTILIHKCYAVNGYIVRHGALICTASGIQNVVSMATAKSFVPCIYLYNWCQFLQLPTEV